MQQNQENECQSVAMEVTLAASSEGAISAFVNAFLGVRSVSVNGSFLAQFPLSSTERLPTTLRAINSVSSSAVSSLSNSNCGF